MTITTQETRKQALLESTEAKFGFVPNVLKKMSASPAALEAYLAGQTALGAEGNQLTDEQRNFVQLATSERNGCNYCTTAHKAIGKVQGSDAAHLDAIGQGHSIPEDAGGAYVDATHLLMEKNGFLDGKDLARLESLGIDRGVIYEIVANIAVKQMTNWVNHIAGTKLDSQFE
ncbi:MAG: carboxymuconolactone decarboxylase family protein [Planctomycetota bacterium]|nr:carboxymuconolactone decarboxylase family protein [Planctomycetota bacterium]